MDTTEEEFCRLCGDLKQFSDLTNLTIDTEKRKGINKMLERFNISLNFDKNLPKSVCFTCTRSLKQAYDFVNSMDLAQKAFEDYMSSSDGEIDDNSVYLDVHSSQDTTETYTLEVSNISEEMTRGDESMINEECTMDDESMPSSLDSSLEPTKLLKKDEIDKNDTETDTDNEVNQDEDSIESDETSNSLSERLEESKIAKINEFEKPIVKKTRETQQVEDTLETETADLKKGRRKSLKMLINSESTHSWKTYKWVCAYCDSYYISPSELRVHSMQYHNICNPFRCFDCRARGSHIDKFVAHVIKHRQNLSLVCHICSSDFNTTGELRQHKLKVHNLRKFTHICGATFQTKEELENHINNFYKNVTIRMTPYKDNEVLMCVICKKILKTKVLLNRHLLLHTDRKRNYLCKVCKKRFYTKRELTQHVVVHSNKRPYKCEICDFSFKIKSELKKHVLKHFEVKRFTCDKCGKNFRLKKELVVHSRVHKDNRPFICAYCNKAFRHKHLLPQHIRIHTGEKPYACDSCPQRFRNWPNYNRHSKEVHGINRAKKKTNEGKDKDKVTKWGNEILEPKKKGRPKKSYGSKKI
ncbi:zinc finger protein 62 homolog [Spodoptera litura]|uniref:Zinc finger protein 62 homolog n=1 Tax=Spodoptera litura TaxID=69820 RepID=A0A9J7DRQ0_SPOLT|nr:zinc finger protein 62 homolog [Spodoptera litura]